MIIISAWAYVQLCGEEIYEWMIIGDFFFSLIFFYFVLFMINVYDLIIERKKSTLRLLS